MDKDIAGLNDHDILLLMYQQVKDMKEDVRELKGGTQDAQRDHELRIRRLELWGGIAVGIAYALEFYFQYTK